MTTFIAHIDGSIYGYGASAAEAVTDARSQWNPVDGAAPHFETDEASPALAIELSNGHYPTITIYQGVAMTYAEQARHLDNYFTAEATAEAAHDHAITEVKPPLPALIWEPEFRAACGRMARAAASGHKSVKLTKRGVPVWVATDAPLSPYRATAATELTERLGDRTLEFAITAERTAATNRLRHIGEALYGAEWVSPLARLTGVNLRTMQRWADGSNTPNFNWLDDAAVKITIKNRLAQMAEATVVLNSL